MSLRTSLLGLFLPLLQVLPVPASAASPVTLGAPSALSGNGCNPSTARATLSPDGSAISLLFDSLVAEAGGFHDTQDRRSCILDLPVRVAPGYQVAVSAVDTRGFVSLPARGYAQFAILFNLARFTPVRIDRRVGGQPGPVDTTFNFHNQLRKEDVDPRWSSCGASTTLRVNTSLIVVSNAQRESALGGIDSADLASGVDLQLQVRPCRGSGR